MSEKVNCSGIRELFSAMLDGEPAGEDRARLEEHLMACESCKKEYDLWERIAETLRTETASGEPSPGFTAAVMGRLQEEKARRRPSGAWRAPAAAAAAAVMLFAGSWGVGVALKDNRPQTEIVMKQEQGDADTAKQPDAAPVPVTPEKAGQPESAVRTPSPSPAGGEPGSGGPEVKPEAPVPAAPKPVDQVKYTALLNSHKDVLSTILKLSVANTQDAGNTALALAASRGGGGQVLTTQRKGDGELVILRITVAREAGKDLVAQLSGLGGVISRVDEKRDITDNYTRAMYRLDEIQDRMKAGVPADERRQLEAEASGLKRQIESWNSETGGYFIILWLEH